MGEDKRHESASHRYSKGQASRSGTEIDQSRPRSWGPLDHSSLASLPGSFGWGVDDVRAARQDSAREQRADYARNHPGVQYSAPGVNPHSAVLLDIDRLFPKKSGDLYKDLHGSVSANYSSVEQQQQPHAGLAPRGYSRNVSSSVPEYRKSTRQEADQSQVPERILYSKSAPQEHLNAQFDDMDGHSACKITYEWELPMLCRDSLQSTEPSVSDVQGYLSSFITITGNENGFQCCTCLEFLTEMWSEIGINALRAVSQGVLLALLSEKARTTQTDGESDFQVIFSTEYHIQVLIEGFRTVQEQRDLAEAILWVCTAVRQIPVRSFSNSEGIFKSVTSKLVNESVEKSSFHFTLSPLEKWSANTLDESTCWTTLFQSGVVAWRPLHRQWGKGIEMSFEMMVDLAAAENYYSLNGGLILLGYKTALIPVDWNEEANSFQWHFEVMEDSATGFVQPSLLKATQKEWTKLQHPSQFQKARCFIGWFEVAHVMLGTRELLERQEKISWSGSEQCRETLHSEGYEGALQMSFSFAPISLGFQGVKTYSKRSNVRRYTPTDSYRSTLAECRRKVALVIDSATEQAWLVPYLSLILHLCHRYFQNTSTEHTAPNPIPFAKPSCNGHEAALEAMLDKGDIIVLGEPGKADSESLRQLILRIHLGFAEAVNIREEPKRGFIFATELMSIIEPPMTGTPLSKVCVSDPRSVAGSWQEIVKSVDVMGVCAGLGKAIMPVSKPGNACPDCSTLPEGVLYLAAHMHCLDALAFRARSDGTVDRIVEGSCPLGDSKTVWQCTANPWNTCNGPGHTSIWEKSPSCQILQHISTGELKTKAKPVIKAPVTKDGVVVFGDRHRAHHPMKRFLGGGRDYMQAKLMALRPLVPQPSQAGSP